MKIIGEELKMRTSQSHTGFRRCTWNEIYENEVELVNDLMRINLNTYRYKLPRGTEYIKSFQQRIKNGGVLTEKQMVQLKRLAPEIAYALYVLGNN